MEKITKEELQEKVLGTPLSDDELEKVSGGARNSCHYKCLQIEDTVLRNICIQDCYK